MKNKKMAQKLLTALIVLNIGFIHAQELHTQSNAASIANESNTVSGWGGSALEYSDATEFYSGSYSLKFESPNDGWNYAAYSFATTPNEQYVISFYAKSASSTNPGIYWGGGGVVENQSIGITSSNWIQYSKTVTANGSTININVYPGTPALTGESVYIDHVSIVPVNSTDTEAPTAPSLVTNGQTDTTVDLSWSGATDDSGITSYKVYKDGGLEATLGNVTSYQITGLTASTSYDFTVTALDAAGNESAPSNTVSVTMDSSSGGGSTGSVWTETGSVASYSGKVAIGTSSVPSGYAMAIDGKLISEEIKVQLSGNWPDYVFKDGYDLLSLEEIRKYIDEKGHLPNIPSAKEVGQNGMEVGEMNRLLLEKIEELTLYLLQYEERILKLEKQNMKFHKEILNLKNIKS